MPTPKTKTPELIGDEHPITKWQINRIMSNCQYNEEIKTEWVQWATGDVNRTSLKSINQAEAKKIILAQTGGEIITQPQGEYFGKFDYKKPSHRKILATMRTLQWTRVDPQKGEIPDMDILDKFLKSNRSPVSKPLMKMSDTEVQKIIIALSNIVKSKYK